MPSPRATQEQRERTVEFYRRMRELRELERQRSRETMRNFAFVMALLFLGVLLATGSPEKAGTVTGVVAFAASGIYAFGRYE